MCTTLGTVDRRQTGSDSRPQEAKNPADTVNYLRYMMATTSIACIQTSTEKWKV